ncbi:kinase-like domain-containing protein [Mycena galopus ATCC 62051]|nr:kinase-like domain-containing protein [Mycena galopus ATCC 62051]
MSAEFEGFMFQDEEGYEATSEYRFGGLCPVRLGGNLGSPPRYRIIAKLGYGACSTVWLSHDRIAKRNVALKIVVARMSTSNELTVLQRLDTPDTEEPRVIQLLDAFMHQSPNGLHQVLVMELVYPVNLFRRHATPVITQEALRQTIEGLVSIHSHGIAHGDLHPGNFGIAVPQAEQISVMDIWNITGRPEVVAVLHSSSDNLESFPQHLCTKIDLGWLLLRGAPEFQQRPLSMRILDLGNAYIVRESCPPSTTPIAYAAPEVAFAQKALNDFDAPWDQRSDIWSLALCCPYSSSDPQIYALACGHDFFDFFGYGNRVLHELMYYCGEVPDAWRAYLHTNPFRDGILPGPEHAERLWQEKAQVLSECGAENPVSLARLLRRMMQLDPAKRPTAAELLRDPYFDGLPAAGGVSLRDLAKPPPTPELPKRDEAGDMQSNTLLGCIPEERPAAARDPYVDGMREADGALLLRDTPDHGEEGDIQSNSPLD